jgi:hypothetical protein
MKKRGIPEYFQMSQGEMGNMAQCDGSVIAWRPRWHEYDVERHECNCPECTVTDIEHVKVDLAIPSLHAQERHSGATYHCLVCGKDWFDIGAELKAIYSVDPFRDIIDQGAPFYGSLADKVGK